jgi:hypothetical protein
VDDWFPNILNNYKAFVKYTYDVEKSEMDETEFLKDYLKQDLEVKKK